MMTKKALPPSLNKVKERTVKTQKLFERWDALIAITDHVIAELEAEQLKNSLYHNRLKKAMQVINIEPKILIESKSCLD